MERFAGEVLVPYHEAETEGTKGQDLSSAYWRNVAVYGMRRPSIMAKEIPIDLNDEVDLKLAELRLAQREAASPRTSHPGPSKEVLPWRR